MKMRARKWSTPKVMRKFRPDSGWRVRAAQAFAGPGNSHERQASDRFEDAECAAKCYRCPPRFSARQEGVQTNNRRSNIAAACMVRRITAQRRAQDGAEEIRQQGSAGTRE